MFGNQSVDFNNAFNSNNTTTQSSNTNLMDDFLQPERQSNSSAGMTTDSARLTGDLDQGLQQMAQSLGFLFSLYLKNVEKLSNMIRFYYVELFDYLLIFYF